MTNDALRPALCPACGSTSIEHRELVTAYREVHGVDDSGMLILDGGVSTYDDDGDLPPYLACKDCGVFWPVPADVDFR